MESRSHGKRSPTVIQALTATAATFAPHLPCSPRCRLPPLGALRRLALALTSIVPPSTARVAVGLGARHAGLDSHAVSDLEVGHALADLDDLAGTLVAGATLVGDDHRGADVAVLPEVHVGAGVSLGRGLNDAGAATLSAGT